MHILIEILQTVAILSLIGILLYRDAQASLRASVAEERRQRLLASLSAPAAVGEKPGRVAIRAALAAKLAKGDG